jgi:hypothetical protein
MGVMRMVLVMCLAGCYSPAPQAGAPCGTNGECPDGLACGPLNTCEKPGTFADAPPGECVASCTDDMLFDCTQMIACANGCSTTGEAHCMQLKPSNGLTAMMLDGASADVLLDKLNFEADTGRIRMMNTDYRPAGTGIKNGIGWEIVDGVGVFSATSWTLPPASSWTFAGSMPVALFAAKTITIGATIDVGATGVGGVLGGTNGTPSITVTCHGRAGRNIDATHGEGGGGGGGGSAAKGGNGGISNQGGTATGIGGACASSPTTIPLRGGNGGGHGAANAANFGGGGGGAIALVAMESVTIPATGVVASPGAGGGVAAAGNGGGGGGGGGAIFIEAPVVTIQGKLTANGGGGAAPSGGSNGARGATTTANPATGGMFMGGNGGAGAAGITAATNGTSYNFDDAVNMTNTNRGGGGGGAKGAIEVKRRIGGVAGLASPAAAITDAVLE